MPDQEQVPAATVWFFPSNDVAHNVAKLERHGGRELCLHRKGATRALPARSAEIPTAYRDVRQPAFIPGSMGTAAPCSSDGRLPWTGASTRSATAPVATSAAPPREKRVSGAELRRELEAADITVGSPSNKGLAEEAPFAYKAVERVVGVVERAGLAARVAELRPIGVEKGLSGASRSQTLRGASRERRPWAHDEDGGARTRRCALPVPPPA